MAERVDAATLDGLSKKELVVLVQSVAPLDLLQANALSGKPENVAKKANKVQTLGCFCYSLVSLFLSHVLARAFALSLSPSCPRSLSLLRTRLLRCTTKYLKTA